MTRPALSSHPKARQNRLWAPVDYGHLSTMVTCRLWSPVAAESAGVQASPVGPVSPRTTMGTCPLIGLNMPLSVTVG